MRSGGEESGSTGRRGFLRTAVGAGLWATTAVGTVLGSVPRTASGEPPEAGEERWRYDTRARAFGVDASPTVVDGTVYVGDWDGIFHAIDASSGERLWRADVADAPIVSAATVVGDLVYFGSEDGGIYALETATGDRVWRFGAGDRVLGSPTLVEGTLYVANEAGFLYALDAATGDLNWRFSADGTVESSPTVVRETVFFGAGSYQYALDAATGDLYWRFDTGGTSESSPTVDRGTVYVGATRKSGLEALDAGTGGLEWRFRSTYTDASPTVGYDVSIPRRPELDRVVVFGDDNGNVFALDPGTGEELWRFRTGGAVVSSPTVADGVAFVGSDDRHVYAIDVDTSALHWRYETGDAVRASPTVADGVVYVASTDGVVYAIEAGVDGSSDGSRVSLGTLGHHDGWTGEMPAGDFDPGTAPEADPDGLPLPGMGVGAAFAGLGGAGYWLARRVEDGDDLTD